MPLQQLEQLLDKYGDDYLLLDFNHLFVTSTLREEVWLLRGHDDPELLKQVIQDAEAFGLIDVQPDRELTSYSGGEQAILAALMVIAILRDQSPSTCGILLNDILDSLSLENRKALLACFRQLDIERAYHIYRLENGKVVEVNIDTAGSENVHLSE